MIMEKKDEKVRQLVMLASMADEAMIFNDSKKEMYQDIHKCLEKRGYEVMCIDLRNSQYSDKWNPLGAMINKYKKLEKEFTEYSRIAGNADCAYRDLYNKLYDESEYDEIRDTCDFSFPLDDDELDDLKDKAEFHFFKHIDMVNKIEDGYEVVCGNETYTSTQCIISTGRSGSKWMESVCSNLGIETKSDRVDIGVRVELNADTFSELTDSLYESKIVYRSKKYQDRVRTFCMNPRGVVVNENTNGIITVNGHSYEDPARFTNNTNFALLVSNHFTEPFSQSNQYGESIARLSNMLGGGVIVQRFGDLIRGQRSTPSRIAQGFVTPTLKATPGDLSLVIPKRQLDDIIEMIYALDKVCPSTASDDTLLYGVEVKFYNMQVKVDKNLETKHKGLFVIGDCSGVTHSLSHASASGVYVARHITENL